MIEVHWAGEWVDVGDYKLPTAFALRDSARKGSDEPNLLVEFEVRDGVPVCRRVVFEATADGREVRTSDLRRLRVEDLLEDATTNVAHREDSEGEYYRNFQEWRDVVRAVRSKRRDGRRRISDDVLREVAEVYRANVEQYPTRAVADHLGGVADRTARLYVRRARDAGFLGPSLKGKGGEA